MTGMMLHQDASRHVGFPAGAGFDLVITLDDATGEIYSAFLVDEEGTASTFRALARGLRPPRPAVQPLHRPRQPLLITTKAGEKPDPKVKTQVGRALAQLGIEHIPAFSPEARGRSERAFRTLQDRLPKELALAGITYIAEANRFLREVYLAAHNARFAVPAEQPGRPLSPSIRGPRRHPVHPGGSPGRQRQHRQLQPPPPADSAEPDPAALRAGQGPGSPVPRWHLRHLPWPPLPRPLRRRRRSARRNPDPTA